MTQSRKKVLGSRPGEMVSAARKLNMTKCRHKQSSFDEIREDNCTIAKNKSVPIKMVSVAVSAAHNTEKTKKCRYEHVNISQLRCSSIPNIM